MTRRKATKAGAEAISPPLSVVPVGTVATTLPEMKTVLTPLEETVARYFVLCGNATEAWLKAHPDWNGKRNVAWVKAWKMINQPHVLARIREYESAAAAATVIDYAAILEHDRAIYEGYKHADEISRIVRNCCRWCHGVDHNYQWIDFEEYLAALSKAQEENEARRRHRQRELPLPSEEGGYGFDAQNEPSYTCPKCEGLGIEKVIFADTTKLTGPARVIVKGIKQTNNGTEVLLHDIDKAKERLLRAGRIFGDDAASVARGAAAGAAAGATAAIAAAQHIEEGEMSADEAQRIYQSLV